MGSRMRNWCFTKYDLNIPEFDPDVVRYCVYQHEICPDTGREHIQGYVEFKKSIRLAAVKVLFNDDSIHLERRQGTRDQAKAYCMKADSRKEGTSPVEFGTWDVSPGRRSDLQRVYDQISNGADDGEIAELYPIEYMKYSRAIKEMIRVIRNRNECRAIVDSLETVDLRPWQSQVVTEIQIQNDREVMWVHDSEGGKGKSFLTKYLKFKYNAYVVTGGTQNDIAYDYNFQKIVVFDLARESQFMPYQLIENFKNGLIFSAKYESNMKISMGVRVLVFSNSLPDLNKLSADRWNIKTI